ncbi:hypothetical protein LX69_03105 [Breznakibacter xylanolyticus]|uniref:Uncharacterized protein n=1 Tax=Breznakibacter xylanolyticus TaxID=990 RepID=A0A2W7PPS9_9BACT|nr:hypothetical protein [Breznakibacter xylanolyticus]PZX11379.1 hypothetical protein LX69_03105 [Breznakibacter xylanolyticus]
MQLSISNASQKHSNFASEYDNERSQSKLLTRLNQIAIERISKKAINQLKKLKNDVLLSGMDSGLNNTWDEICVQVQTEYSAGWYAYQSTIENTINNCLEAEPDAIKQLTSYMSILNEQPDDITYSSEYAIRSIYDEVISIAMNFSNKRIDVYLEK